MPFLLLGPFVHCGFSATFLVLWLVFAGFTCADGELLNLRFFNFFFFLFLVCENKQERLNATSCFSGVYFYYLYIFNFFNEIAGARDGARCWQRLLFYNLLALTLN